MNESHAAPTSRKAPGTSSRGLSDFVLFAGGRARPHVPQIEPLLRALKTHHPKADVSVIERAYATAELHHRGQMRKSGEPYITHPVAVATILAEMGMTPPTLVAALLHDTVEDTDYTVEELTSDFGESIAHLVDGVTKLDKIRYGENAQSETLRKMIVAMSRDLRVLLIKLADRLHNARTWKFVPRASAQKKARETLEIYAPLAHRLGVNTIKWELEELSFKTLYPEIYEEIDRLVQERSPQRVSYLADLIAHIERELAASGVKGTVGGRPKNHYSIYQKMIVRGKAFDEIFDLVAVRVLVDTVKDCYSVLGSVHGQWNPIPGRFKDYIAMPKFNLYQSLHTTVVGPGGRPIEIQIRTYEMHERAESGVAAHWKYKQNPTATSGQDGDKMSHEEQMNWMRSLIELERETGDPEEFLDSLRYEISADEVYVFTPKGEVVVLPAHATPVDFAYSVHTEVGHRTVGAKVNGRLVPLDTKLESGETVEIVTSKSDKAGPSRDWNAFVASPRAKAKIKAWFSKERREEAIEAGKERLAKVMRKQNLPLQRLMSHDSLQSLATGLGYLDVSALYAAVGEGNISAQHVVNKLLETLGGSDGTEETLSEGILPGSTRMPSHQKSAIGVSVDGLSSKDVWVKLAKCCTPVPGDSIVGFITRGQGCSVHLSECQNAIRLGETHPERFVEVEWNGQISGGPYMVQIEVQALDRAGMLADLTRVLSDYRVNIHAVSSQTSRDQVATVRFQFELADLSHLNAVLSALRRVDSVFDARRRTGTEKPIGMNESEDHDVFDELEDQ